MSNSSFHHAAVHALFSETALVLFCRTQKDETVSLKEFRNWIYAVRYLDWVGFHTFRKKIGTFRKEIKIVGNCGKIKQ